MKEGTWSQAIAELAAVMAAAIVRFWKQAIVHVGLSVGTLLVLALPFLIVILIFWYIDSTGWRPQSGFYKIGQREAAEKQQENTVLSYCCESTLWPAVSFTDARLSGN